MRVAFALKADVRSHLNGLHNDVNNDKLIIRVCLLHPVFLSDVSSDVIGVISKYHGKCICDINEWMSSNRLKLNADKTQFIWLGSPQQLASVRMEELSIGGAAVAPVDTARDLGVTLDAQLTLDKHVDSVVRSCFYTSSASCARSGDH